MGASGAAPMFSRLLRLAPKEWELDGQCFGDWERSGKPGSIAFSKFCKANSKWPWATAEPAQLQTSLRLTSKPRTGQARPVGRHGLAVLLNLPSIRFE